MNLDFDNVLSEETDYRHPRAHLEPLPSPWARVRIALMFLLAPVMGALAAFLLIATKLS